MLRLLDANGNVIDTVDRHTDRRPAVSSPIGPAPRRRRRVMIPAVLVATVVAVPVGWTGAAAADGDRGGRACRLRHADRRHRCPDDLGAIVVGRHRHRAGNERRRHSDAVDLRVHRLRRLPRDVRRPRRRCSSASPTRRTCSRGSTGSASRPPRAPPPPASRTTTARSSAWPRPSSSAAPRAKRHCWSSPRTPATTRRGPMSCRSRRRHQSTRPCSSRSWPASTRSGSRARSARTTPRRLPPRPRSPNNRRLRPRSRCPTARHSCRRPRLVRRGRHRACATEPFTPSNSIAEGAVQITDDTRTITVRGAA